MKQPGFFDVEERLGRLSSIGNIPPAEAEARFYAQQKSHTLAA
ncbi:hypothetical protein [Komagataeibacter europaeus]|nr:hypothetical protein [Komagataeibacter europaeus]